MSKFLKVSATIAVGAVLGVIVASAIGNSGDGGESQELAVANAAALADDQTVAENGMSSNQIIAPEEGYGLGRRALLYEVAAWNIDVRPDGMGLPPGSGDVWTGEELYVEKCASCHGDFGEAVGRWPVLAGGQDTLSEEDPVKTIGSYWPYLSTVFDYVNRAMPFGAAQTLEPDEVYAITAYLLYLNDEVDDDFELSRDTFLDVSLPNQDNFYLDDRATLELGEFSAEPCMNNCKRDVEITMRASVLDVTPDVEDDATVASAVAETPSVSQQAELETSSDVQPEVVSTQDAADVALANLIAEGENVFKKCIACHKVGEGARNGVGPQLNDLIGRPVGELDDYRYSQALQAAAESGTNWDQALLTSFLIDPKGTFPGTKMAFRGLSDPSELEAVFAYLGTFSTAQQTEAIETMPEEVEAAELAGFEVSADILAIVGDPAYGEYLSGECTSCHLINGSDSGIPPITNWPNTSFVTAMHAYKQGEREHPVMQMMAARLSNEEIAGLAAYFNGVE